ncbi:MULTISPECIES: hypothetical protein [unclassified Streptomyces]|uniref:SecDF P1 head subdomain-containing protein n=1 Tax=unclassified Streptomyces TaxID=2593676 RepID=UPI001F04D487|nr:MULTISPECIES: hypothetical protein [unclassified Streptomyces]MCH0562413.1 hypothetical protein [Streptomyces sp. MUM 2J]MCH0570499.1 hypothetical protein [Streptomyces sp. MUM 136J]
MAVLTGCSGTSPARPGATPPGTAVGAAPTTADWSQVTFDVASSATADALTRTVDRMRERAENLGMAEVRIESKSGSVSATGPYPTEQLKGLGSSGQLRFRPVLAEQVAGVPTDRPGPGSSPLGRAVTQDLRADVSPTPQAAPTGKAGSGRSLDAGFATLDCSADGAHPRPDLEASAHVPVLACAAHGRSGQPPAKYELGPAMLTGSDVESARAAYNTNGGGWIIELAFTGAGSARLAAATGQLAKNPPPQNEFAIVVDGEVVSAPAVGQALTGGNAQIAGGFTKQEAQALAAQLTSGALPVPLRFSGAARFAGP